MKKLLTAIALTAFLSGTAFASSCPMHVMSYMSPTRPDWKTRSQVLRRIVPESVSAR